MVLGVWIDFHNHTIFSKGSSRRLHAARGHRRWSGANLSSAVIHRWTNLSKRRCKRLRWLLRPVSRDKTYQLSPHSVTWVMPKTVATSVTVMSSLSGYWVQHWLWRLAPLSCQLNSRWPNCSDVFLEITRCVTLWHHFGFHRRRYPLSLPIRHCYCRHQRSSYQDKMQPSFYLMATTVVSNAPSYLTHPGQSLQW